MAVSKFITLPAGAAMLLALNVVPAPAQSAPAPVTDGGSYGVPWATPANIAAAWCDLAAAGGSPQAQEAANR